MPPAVILLPNIYSTHGSPDSGVRPAYALHSPLATKSLGASSVVGRCSGGHFRFLPSQSGGRAPERCGSRTVRADGSGSVGTASRAPGCPLPQVLQDALVASGEVHRPAGFAVGFSAHPSTVFAPPYRWRWPWLLMREKSRRLWHHRIRLRCFGQESPGAAQRCWVENREGGASPPRAQRCKEDGRCIGH
jgi:hypothetical protein